MDSVSEKATACATFEVSDGESSGGGGGHAGVSTHLVALVAEEAVPAIRLEHHSQAGDRVGGLGTVSFAGGGASGHGGAGGRRRCAGVDRGGEVAGAWRRAGVSANSV